FLTVDSHERHGSAAVVADHCGGLATGHYALDSDDIDALLARFTPYRHQAGHPDVHALERLRAMRFRTHPVPGHGHPPVVAVLVDADAPPATAVDVYLRLHLLSLRRMRPRSLNLDGAFGKLNTNVWTTTGVIDQQRFDEIQREQTLAGEPLVVLLQDKF